MLKGRMNLCMQSPKTKSKIAMFTVGLTIHLFSLLARASITSQMPPTVVCQNGWAGAPDQFKNPRPPLCAKKPKGSVSVTKWYVYSLFHDYKNYQTTGKNLVY